MYSQATKQKALKMIQNECEERGYSKTECSCVTGKMGRILDEIVNVKSCMKTETGREEFEGKMGE